MAGFKVLLAKPRGFCRGVEMAVEALEIGLLLCPSPLYAKHEIVHNRFVVERFKKQGVVFVESVDEIPDGAFAFFSAHGSPIEDYKQARQRGIDVIDATCQLVTNVHNWARKYAKMGYTVIVVGHRDHVEPKGTLSHIPLTLRRFVENEEEARRLSVNNSERVACVTQTTLVVKDTSNILGILRSRFPHLVEPPAPTICYATDNRQSAIEKIARQAQVVYVIGSVASSNSNSLRNVAESLGARAYLIDSAQQIKRRDLKGAKRVGVSSGASAPEIKVSEVIKKLMGLGASELREVEVVNEKVSSFRLPKRLIELAQEQKLDIDELRKKARQSWL